MPEPTNPKKRSLMGASKLRKALRAAGHRLNPIVQIGKEGVTPGVLAQLSEALDHHELVKVKVGTESPEDRFESADRIAAEGNAQVAQVIGRVILVYRRHATAPKFEPLAGPRLALPDDDDAPAPRKRAASERPQPETRKAPSRSREEFWQRKVAAEGRSRPEGGWSRKSPAAGARPEGGRRIWTEKPPRKEIPKGPAGQAKELVGRRSKAAAGRPPPRGGPRGRPAAGKRPPRAR
jgi:RNA-binding protein